MNGMKITTRLVAPLILVAAFVAMAFSYTQVRSERIRLAEDLERRAVVLAESFQETLKDRLRQNAAQKIDRLVKQFGNRDKLAGIAVYDAEGKALASTPGLLEDGSEPSRHVLKALEENVSVSTLEEIKGRNLHVYAVSVVEDEKNLGAFAVFHDAAYIDARLKAIWHRNFVRFLILSLLITITTVVIVRWSITGPIAGFAEWLKGVRTGKTIKAYTPRGYILGPLEAEAALLAKSLALARAAAEQEAKLRLTSESLWTAERLKEYIRRELGGKNLFVISNREPYMHIKKGSAVECIVPAGGVVTALDPIMRACGGVWVAHGSADADRETSDRDGRLKVPPEDPLYTLKRVWLTKEEEEGYYYRFSNEGLWPLCHITHTRPLFRLNDWIHYQMVNEKFAEALLEEIEGEEAPFVLVQDYHFALLPLLIKSKRPDARVGIFWHIPWPNPEIFSICPWKEELLIGLLGADFVGFQTQFHCNNFLETVDRVLESKINWDQFYVERGGLRTFVKPFPISVAFPGPKEGLKQEGLKAGAAREAVLKDINVKSEFIGVGVDRIDYTKGIVERFRAVERFLERYPEYIGRFTFVELGSPSRTLIKRYHDLINEVEETSEKINWRFQTGGWKPIVLLKDHHVHEKIDRYYRAADLCMVTSLHDGMNLVAKEFVSSRNDEDGVLILSQFAGASMELRDALIVNPYDIEDMAEAIRAALTMPPSERGERMKNMRAVVRERNIYRWASRLVTELSRVRVLKDAENSKNPEDLSGISL